MAIENFDGPVRQIESLNINSLRRYPSQPSITIDGEVTMLKGLDQNALGELTGGNHVTLSGLDTGAVRKSLGQEAVTSQSLSIRTLHTAPKLQHVPGSYRSEPGSTNDDQSTTATSETDGLSPIVREIEHWTTIYKIADKPPKQSTKIVVRTGNDQKSSLPAPLVRHFRSQPSIRNGGSTSTLRSTISAESRNHLLPQPIVEYLNTEEVDKPTLATGIKYRNSHNERSKGSSEVVDAQSNDSQVSSSVSSIRVFMPNSIPPRSSSEHFSKIDLGNYRTSEYSPDALSLETAKSECIHNPVNENSHDAFIWPPRPRISSFIADQESSLQENTVIKRRISNANSNENSSISAVGPRVECGTNDSCHEDNGVKQASLSSSMSTQSINRNRDLLQSAMKVQSLKDLSYQPSNMHSSNTVRDQPPSKREWVRQMLSTKAVAPMSLAMPNLTARPVRKQLDKTAHNFPRRKSSSTESTNPDFIKRQQENDESFSNIILDLEDLLNEALTIAKQSADKDEENINFLQTFDGVPNGHAHSTDVNKGIYAKEYITVAEPANMFTQEPRVERHRDATPYPTTEAQHASLAPFVFPVLSTSDHAKQLVAQLGLPKIAPDSHLVVPKPLTLPHSKSPQHRPQDLSSPRKSIDASGMPIEYSESNDWALTSRSPGYHLETHELQPVPQKPDLTQSPEKEQFNHLLREHKPPLGAKSRESVLESVNTHHAPPVQSRTSSLRPHSQASPESGISSNGLEKISLSEWDYSSSDSYKSDDNILDTGIPGLRKRSVAPEWAESEQRTYPRLGPGALPKQDTMTSLHDPQLSSQQPTSQQEELKRPGHSLRGRSHFSIRNQQGFSLSRSHRRAPIARDWSLRRKRYVATVACINTALLGLIVGIYAGEVPAIQYAIADEHHYTILGNVVFYIGLAIPTALFWPLPLLHGRKPYTLAALTLLLTLQFPQAMIVVASRSPYVANYRVGLLLSRTFAGLAMGFANINFQTTLLDLFGSSLQSKTPHQETVNPNDVRRHGGGMGLWLGVWTWCFIGSISVGFLIGAAIINSLNVSWGFWITIVVTAVVLVLNVLTPEVRRSSYRRSVAEVRHGTTFSKRVARGEVKMHLYQTGPKHWTEEVTAGIVLCFRMLKQPGFVVLSFYIGWIYGQVVIVIVLLGALLSRYYRFHSPYVGLCVLVISIGALLAIPFQKGSWFSRSRKFPPRTDSMTFEKRITWTTHLVRRAIFMIVLPFAGLAYTLSSGGPHTPFILPTLFAGLIGFLSNLAIAECNGLIMETFDTSDLQPGMTGRPRPVLPDGVQKQRTNYSSFPRVTAGFAITQTFAFLLAAAATGTGGALERRLGAQTATAVMAGVLLLLTLLLTAIVIRFKTVQVVPSERYGTNVLSGPEDEWKPVIIGNPSGTTRRISLLELGEMTRWTEIRRRNRLLK